MPAMRFSRVPRLKGSTLVAVVYFADNHGMIQIYSMSF